MFICPFLFAIASLLSINRADDECDLDDALVTVGFTPKSRDLIPNNVLFKAACKDNNHVVVSTKKHHILKEFKYGCPVADANYFTPNGLRDGDSADFTDCGELKWNDLCKGDSQHVNKDRAINFANYQILEKVHIVDQGVGFRCKGDNTRTFTIKCKSDFTDFDYYYGTGNVENLMRIDDIETFCLDAFNDSITPDGANDCSILKLKDLLVDKTKALKTSILFDKTSIELYCPVGTYFVLSVRETGSNNVIPAHKFYTNKKKYTCATKNITEDPARIVSNECEAIPANEFACFKTDLNPAFEYFYPLKTIDIKRKAFCKTNKRVTIDVICNDGTYVYLKQNNVIPSTKFSDYCDTEGMGYKFENNGDYFGDNNCDISEFEGFKTDAAYQNELENKILFNGVSLDLYCPDSTHLWVKKTSGTTISQLVKKTTLFCKSGSLIKTPNVDNMACEAVLNAALKCYSNALEPTLEYVYPITPSDQSRVAYCISNPKITIKVECNSYNLSYSKKGVIINNDGTVNHLTNYCAENGKGKELESKVTSLPNDCNVANYGGFTVNESLDPIVKVSSLIMHNGMSMELFCPDPTNYWVSESSSVFTVVRKTVLSCDSTKTTTIPDISSSSCIALTDDHKGCFTTDIDKQFEFAYPFKSNDTKRKAYCKDNPTVSINIECDKEKKLTYKKVNREMKGDDLKSYCTAKGKGIELESGLDEK